MTGKKVRVKIVKAVVSDEAYMVGNTYDAELLPHSGGAKIVDERGIHAMSPNEYRIVIDHKIVITTDGNETLARLYENDKVIRKATAKCSPKDEFSFEAGANIAFDRLFPSKQEAHKEEWLNGRFVCVEPISRLAQGFFSVGRVYNVEDGAIIDDLGGKADGFRHNDYERPTGRYKPDGLWSLGFRFVKIKEE